MPATEDTTSDSNLETGLGAASDGFQRFLDSDGETEEPPKKSGDSAPEEEDQYEAESQEEEEEELLETEDEDDEEPDDEEPEQGEEQKFEVKIDGEKSEATLDELIAGYSQNASYTQKSQTLAEERRQFEGELAESRQVRDQAVQILQELQEQNKPVEHDEQYWENLKENDPLQYLTERDTLRETQVQLQLREHQQKILQAQKAQEQEMQMNRYVDEQRGKLAELIPEWSDNDAADSERKLIWEYGRKMGFSDEELDHAYDARAVATLRKAALFDQLQVKRKGIKPVQRPTLKAGNSPGDPKRLKQSKAQARLRKTGKVEDAAPFFYDLIRSS